MLDAIPINKQITDTGHVSIMKNEDSSSSNFNAASTITPIVRYIIIKNIDFNFSVLSIIFEH